MMAIDFVVRSSAGAVERGAIPADEMVAKVAVGAGQDVSLNLRQSDLRGYSRAGQDLQMTLADGRVIVIEGFFSDAEANRLFLSTDGTLHEVTLVEGSGGMLFADYGPAAEWGKWSADDALIFVEGQELADAELIAPAPAPEDNVAMLAPGLLGGAGLLGMAGPALAGSALAGGALLAATAVGGSDGGTAGSDTAGAKAPPTVDEPESTVVQGGRDGPDVDITGTGEPDATVTVGLGEWTRDTVIGNDGTWGVTFSGDDYPDDGLYEAVVIVTDPDGEISELDGPTVDIDFTPPEVTVEYGTVSTGDLVNAEGHPTGCTIGGTSEPGALLEVTAGEVTHTVVVSPDGSWSVTFTADELPGGEYDQGVTITAADVRGNSAITTDAVRIDTVPHPLTIDEDTIEGDGVVNAAERADGVTITGTSTAGAVVACTAYGTTLETVTGDDGTWSVTFDPAVFATGEYDATITATTVDAAGNGSATSGTIHIDTETGVSLDTGLAGGDDMVSGADRSGGFAITGQAEPGAVLEITFQGQSYAATATASGSWSVSVPTADIPAGTYGAPISVTATDAAGNTATTGGVVNVDTEGTVSFSDVPVEGDGTVNAAERADGVTLTGATEPGSTVVVAVAGTSRAASVDAAGNWTVDFLASELPEGETSVTAMASATDAVGNTSSAELVIDIDTLVRDYAITEVAGGADGVVNSVEHAAGLSFGGTVEPGSTLVVQLGTAERAASVAADGTWTVNFASSDVPLGEYAATLTATATDAAGNSATLTRSVSIDTDAGRLAIDPEPIETDDIVNKVEHSDGVTITGTSDAGAVVTVTLGSASQSVVTAPDGTWSATYAASEIPEGTYEAEITATRTDAAGNVIDATDSVSVDTEVLNFALGDAPAAFADAVNHDELAGGFTLTGTTEPGGTLSVTIGSATRAASVDADGNWSVDFSAADLPQGEYEVTAAIDTTDRAGNTSQLETSFAVDTLVNELSADTPPAVMNAAAVAGGLELTGTVEAGSTIAVAFEGLAHTASVDAAGNWSVLIPASAIPRGEYDADVAVHATDAAGNTADLDLAGAIRIDTEAPDGPIVEAVNFDRSGDIRDISVGIGDDALSVGHVQPDGSVTDLTPDLTLTDIEVIGETNVFFGQSVPDGSHLVVSHTDDAGNASGTYLVVNETGTSQVSAANPNLGAHQIEAIDLSFAENSELTITEAQLLSLSSHSDTVKVYGGSDDGVTISGAVLTGTANEGGHDFNVYALGEGTVMIEDEITAQTNTVI